MGFDGYEGVLWCGFRVGCGGDGVGCGGDWVVIGVGTSFDFWGSRIVIP